MIFVALTKKFFGVKYHYATILSKKINRESRRGGIFYGVKTV